MNKRALKHLAAEHGMRQNQLAAALEVAGRASGKATMLRTQAAVLRESTIARGGRTTHAHCQYRIEAALPVAEKLHADLERGRERQRRRDRQSPATLTVQGRKDRIVQMLLGSWVGSLPGQEYSGKTHYHVAHGEPRAWTDISAGEPYPGNCTWRQTDANHHIRATISGLLRVRRAGLPFHCPYDRATIIDCELVRVEPNGRIFKALAVTESRKSIRDVDVWLADRGNGQIHFAKTERGALLVLRRAANVAADRERTKADDATGTVTSTALSLRHSWCSGGIRQWCKKHGIRRNLDRRLKEGCSKVAILRLIKKHGGPSDSYERTLVSHCS